MTIGTILPQSRLNERGSLLVREYTAPPSPMITGGSTPDRREEFIEAVQNQLPVFQFTTEEHPLQPELFGDVFVAELETDRIQLDAFIEFLNTYKSLLEVEDLRVPNVGIDVQVDDKNSVPIASPQTEFIPVLLLEIRFPSDFSRRDIHGIMQELFNEFEWIANWSMASQKSALVQHHGGVNDLVTAQALDWRESLESVRVDPSDVTITSDVVESKDRGI